MTPLLYLLVACSTAEPPAGPEPSAAARAHEPSAAARAHEPAPVSDAPTPPDAPEAPASSTDLLALFGSGPPPVDTSRWTHEPPPELAEPDHAGAWYNGAGYRYYKDGDLPAAAALFARATEVDPDHALGHYNLACTLALIRTAGPSAVCEHGAYRQQVFEALARAVELDPGHRVRMRTDHDLDGVRHSLRYELIDGADPKNPQHVHNMLVGATLWGPGVGVFGSTRKVLFQSDGALVEAWLEMMAGAPAWLAARGTWSMDGLTIVVKLHDGEHHYTLDPGGALLEDGQLAWMDGPSECEA